ncbi:MAG: tyrosine-type recombinase/integrase [Gammaproteobacteria bacterium]|nr:tyrosine-type recombinase/integrase [Gammaproteobacteria bacterium]
MAALTASRAEVLAAHRSVLAEITTSGTMADLIKAYFASSNFEDLALETRKSYERQRDAGGVGLLAVFGKMRCNALKTTHVRQYVDKVGSRLNARTGKRTTTMANRYLALLSVICVWGLQRGYIEHNPCEGVDRFSERARDRYVTDAEYAAVFNAASTPIRAAMEIAYLCAARLSDVLKLTTFELREEGVYIRQGKTAKRQIKAWSPRLKGAIEMCRAEAPAGATRVVCNKKGNGYTRNGFESAWARLREDLAPKGAAVDWTFHDLKAKGISDFEGDKRKFSGHATERMVALYDRKPTLVPTIGSEAEK